MRTKFFFAVAVALTVFCAAASARAASAPLFTGVIIDWSTNTYVPPFFAGKRLPTANSPVNAWVAVFKDGGAVDASQYDIRWYAGDQLIQSGIGATSVSFKAPASANNVVDLQARVQSPSGSLTVANIQLPVVSSVLAITGNYPNNVIASSVATFGALPYFFNVSDASSLSYTWSANGITAQNAENPESATINIGNNVSPGTTIAVSLTATNAADGGSATANGNFIYQPQ